MEAYLYFQVSWAERGTLKRRAMIQTSSPNRTSNLDRGLLPHEGGHSIPFLYEGNLIAGKG